MEGNVHTDSSFFNGFFLFSSYKLLRHRRTAGCTEEDGIMHAVLGGACAVGDKVGQRGDDGAQSIS